MSYKQQGFINAHGAGGHDFVTSGDTVSATQAYTAIFAWGGSAAITYNQTFPGGAVSGESQTISQSDPGIYSAEGMTAVTVTDGGKIIAYRKG